MLTMGVLASLLLAYKTGLIKATENFKLGVVAATGGIALLYLVNIGMRLFGFDGIGFIHEASWMGIAFSGFVVVIAALNLVLDFDFIESGVEAGAPEVHGVVRRLRPGGHAGLAVPGNPAPAVEAAVARLRHDGRLMALALSLRQRLGAKPLAACLLSILAVATAAALDGRWALEDPPDISAESIESLLSIMASSMLVIAIFAAGAMVAAYASASNTASPRSFPLVLADDVSQNAYSMFIAAFIFGVVGLVALQNQGFGAVGRFALFLETALVFALVILTFVRWVDRIARLGRLGNTRRPGPRTPPPMPSAPAGSTPDGAGPRPAACPATPSTSLPRAWAT